MNSEEIYYEYFEYVSPYNVLVVSSDGEIINLLCPFKVIAKATFPDIRLNQFVWVQMVQIAQDRKDVFIINGNAYHVEHFRVILDSN